MKKSIQVAMIVASVVSLSACAPRLGGNDYSLSGTGEISQTFMGTVTAVRPVTLTGQDKGQDGKLGTGAIVGAGAGAVAGSLIGSGKTPWITGTLGALAGGAAGHMIERKATEQQGFEYTVKLDQGDTITISQGAEPAISTGQRVRVIHSAKDRSRIVPA